MIAGIALLLQAASPAPPPEQFSILVPVLDEPCERGTAPDTIVVCADPIPSQQLPYPDASFNG